MAPDAAGASVGVGVDVGVGIEWSRRTAEVAVASVSGWAASTDSAADYDALVRRLALAVGQCGTHCHRQATGGPKLVRAGCAKMTQPELRSRFVAGFPSGAASSQDAGGEVHRSVLPPTGLILRSTAPSSAPPPSRSPHPGHLRPGPLSRAGAALYARRQTWQSSAAMHRLESAGTSSTSGSNASTSAASRTGTRPCSGVGRGRGHAQPEAPGGRPAHHASHQPRGHRIAEPIGLIASTWRPRTTASPAANSAPCSPSVSTDQSEPHWRSASSAASSSSGVASPASHQHLSLGPVDLDDVRGRSYSLPQPVA